MNRQLLALVVDDEPIARKLLCEELELFPNVTVIGEAENGRDALAQISLLRPNLVFLDLQMPVMGGFEVIAKLHGGPIPAIIIVTIQSTCHRGVRGGRDRLSAQADQ